MSGARTRAAWSAWLAAAALHSGAAFAELWAYVDEQGTAHFATQRVDERYRLFFRGRTSLDPPSDTSGPGGARAAPEPSPSLLRVVAHPNVARFAPLIERQAQAHAVDPALVKAMIAVESAFEPAAVSPKGAVGLMQVMPGTGARYGLADDRRRTVAQKLLDPATNLRIGTRYLRDLLVMFEDDVALALAAYNAGEQTVREYGNRVPPFPETREYVALVRQLLELYRPSPLAPRRARPRLLVPPRAPPPADGEREGALAPAEPRSLRRAFRRRIRTFRP